MQYSKEIMDFLNTIVGKLDKETLRKIKKSKYNELCGFHFGLGMYIRNEFLGRETSLYNYFKKMGFDSKDSMSHILICYLYFYLKSK